MQDKGTGSGHRSLREIDLMREAFWVPREEGRPPDVAKLENEHHNSLKSDSSPSVRRTPPSKAVNVVDHTCRVNIIPHQALFQKLRVVDTLAARENLLAADKEVKGIRNFL